MVTYSSCPQGQPYDFQPNGKPEQFNTPDTGIGVGQSTHKQRDQQEQHHGNNIGGIADDEAGGMKFLDENGELGIGFLGGIVDCILFMERIGGLVKLIDILRPARTNARSRAVRVSIPILVLIILGGNRGHPFSFHQSQIIFQTQGLFTSGRGGPEGSQITVMVYFRIDLEVIGITGTGIVLGVRRGDCIVVVVFGVFQLFLILLLPGVLLGRELVHGSRHAGTRPESKRMVRIGEFLVGLLIGC